MSTENWLLYEGDCLAAMAAMPDGSVDAVITDPPYGIAFVSQMRKNADLRHKAVINDDAPYVEWIPEAYRVLREGGSCLMFYRWDVQEPFLVALRDAGFTVKSQIVWSKGGGGIGDLNASFAAEHELALFAVKGAFEFRHGRPMSVIKVPKVRPDQLVHPCEKPVPLMEYLIRMLTDEGEVVLDPFAGCGSTIIAAERLNRRGIGCELDPAYCRIIRGRMRDFQPMLF